MSDRGFFVTTPIYYISGSPHVGHAYTSIAADVLARFHRTRGLPFLLTGTDEHGQKVAQAAAAAGMSPQAWCDALVPRWKELDARFEVTYNDFVRTSEPRHTTQCVTVFERLKESSNLYVGTYEGWYCTNDGTFLGLRRGRAGRGNHDGLARPFRLEHQVALNVVQRAGVEPRCLNCRKLFAETTRKNRPSTPVRISKLPSAVETAVATSFPLLSRMTLAPVILAPEASVTTPRIDAAGHNGEGKAKRMAGEKSEARRGSTSPRRCAETGMMAPSFPSERKRVKSAEDRSPDLRLLQLPSQSKPEGSPPVDSRGIPRVGGKTLAEILPLRTHTTGIEAGALTVAGQWRNFTAFPSILAIAVVQLRCLDREQPMMPWNDFHDINIYNRDGAGSQKSIGAAKPAIASKS